MRIRVSDLLLYRWRYVIGYSFAALIIGTMLYVASIYIPGELRQAEIDSSVASGSLSMKSMTPSMVIDLPYHVLQRVVFILFGVSTFTIKLPSVILGVFTVIGLLLLFQTWFRRNVAIFATVLAVTTTQFIFLAQDGTPGIIYSFLAVWLLFSATYVTRLKIFGTFWKVLACVFLVTSLYTPLGVYLVLAILTTALFHPHIRHVINHFSHVRLSIGIALGCIALAPLIYASIIDHNVAYTILGIPGQMPNIKQNFFTVALDLFGFFSASTGHLVRPLYTIGVTLLIAIGTYKLLTHKYTARSYISLMWGLLLVPLIILNPDRVSSLFPLASLMMALGVAMLVSDWYKLFPRNPYARVAGLLPLTILALGIISSGVLRYVYNYQYNPQVLSAYSKDLVILQGELKTENKSADHTVLIASPGEASFYSMVSHHDKRFTVASAPVAVGTTIVTRAMHDKVSIPSEPYRIITNTRANEADRFYIYKSAPK